MDLTHLTSSSLSKILRLLKKKEALLERVAQVDRALSGFETGSPQPVAAAAKPGKTRFISPAGRARIAAAQRARWAKKNIGKPAKAVKKGARGEVKEAILQALKDSGTAGITVPQLAAKLGMKNANVRAWIYQTGKKLGVKSVARGVFALKG